MGIIFVIIAVLVIGYLIGKNSNKSSFNSPDSKTTKEAVNQSNQVIKIARPIRKKAKIDASLPGNFQLTDEFRDVINTIEILNKNVFITGKAGTGKSTLLRYFKTKTQKKFAVLSPTGIASVNVQGQTIHSFFKLPPALITERTNLYNPEKIEIYKKLDMLIIDEISMVRADTMDAIDKSLRMHRKNSQPFGGVQMIFFGDLYQLPPVVVGKELKTYFETVYQSAYFFSAKVFQEIQFSVTELQKVFRQKDEKFVDLLNNIRIGISLNSDLRLLNSRVVPNFIPKNGDLFITLSTTNAIADNENNRRLSELANPLFLYSAVVTGVFDEKSYPTLKSLSFKKGAQVMMIKNDTAKRWVNGTIGTVKRLSNDKIEVDINGVIHEIKREVWESIEYVFNKEENKIEPIVKGTFEQYPLKLAWAVTIHKSQGQTFEQVIIDLGKGAFAHGQTYVALSRCTSFEGIILKQNIGERDIILDQKVREYMSLANLN